MKKIQEKKKAVEKKTGGHEEKKIVVNLHPRGPYTKKPSTKLTSVKTADPFAATTKKHKTTFGHVYSSGGIPCKIQHGGITNHLSWNNPPIRMPLLHHRTLL